MAEDKKTSIEMSTSKSTNYVIGPFTIFPSLLVRLDLMNGFIQSTWKRMMSRPELSPNGSS